MIHSDFHAATQSPDHIEGQDRIAIGFVPPAKKIVPLGGAVRVVPVFDRGDTSKTKSGSGYADYLDHAPSFTGKRGESTIFAARRTGEDTVILLGMGHATALDRAAGEELGGKLRSILVQNKYKSAVIEQGSQTDIRQAPLRPAEIAAYLANGALLSSYTYTPHKTSDTPKPAEKTEKMELFFETIHPKAAGQQFNALAAVTRGVFLARDYSNEPANIATPENLVCEMVSAAEECGIKIRVLDQKMLVEMKAGAILAVGQGSVHPPYIVVFEYNGVGSRSTTPDLALVGKGVTFDSGGISIKPSAGMQDMKHDMSGAANVAAAIIAMAERKAPVHVVGVVGLVENMPSGNAYKPGDVITALSGKTIEITNTDAEGRLVLADCLTYVQKTYNPKTIIDMATLTGAVRYALGNSMAGVMSNDKTLEAQIIAAGGAVSEPRHPLPLGAVFTKAVRRSSIADLVNSMPGPGASNAAAFLQEFIINPKTFWAHLDIAAVANDADLLLAPANRMASGYGVRLLNALVDRDFSYPAERPATPKKRSPKLDHDKT